MFIKIPGSEQSEQRTLSVVIFTFKIACVSILSYSAEYRFETKKYSNDLIHPLFTPKTNEAHIDELFKIEF